MNRPDAPQMLVVFPSRLGWMALVGAGDTLRRLTFGHRSGTHAVAALGPIVLQHSRRGRWNEALVGRLKAYAAGTPVDFRDVRVDLSDLRPFQQRVIRHCRQIPYGKTLSYGQLAAKAGSPRAARAVGNCMAANRIPLIIPCHRVIPANGRVGGFSAPGGAKTKRRLLALEARHLD